MLFSSISIFLDLRTNVLQCHLYYNIKLSIQLYLLQDEASPLVKEGHSKRMDIQGQAPAKTLIIQFHLHLSTNKQWLANFKILYISSTFTSNNFHEVHFIEIDHNKFCYALKLWFSKMFWKFHWSYVFFTFNVSFFDQNITFFATSFISMLRTTNLFFVFKNKNYRYLCRFYHKCASDLLFWLIG